MTTPDISTPPWCESRTCPSWADCVASCPPRDGTGTIGRRGVGMGIVTMADAITMARATTPDGAIIVTMANVDDESMFVVHDDYPDSDPIVYGVYRRGTDDEHPHAYHAALVTMGNVARDHS